MKKYFVYDIGGTFVKWAIISANNCIRKSGMFVSASKKGEIPDGQVLIDKLINHLNTFNLKKIKAIGISTLGVVNQKSGLIMATSNNIENYVGLNIKKIFENEFRIKTYVENDGNCAILGELEHGELKNSKNINAISLVIGTGIGGGVLIDGKLYKGSLFYAGEFGCLINSGTDYWAKIASTRAIVKKGSIAMNRSLTSTNFLNNLKFSPELEKINQQFINDLSVGISNLLVCFNPSKLIISGSIIVNENFPFENLCTVIKAKFPKHLEFNCQIIKSKLGVNGNLFGIKKICASRTKYWQFDN